MGQVAGLVGHRRALGDVEAEVEIAQPPGPTQLELLEDGEDAGREGLEVGVEVEVDGGERVIGAVDDGDADELAGVAIADLEGVAAGVDQEGACANSSSSHHPSGTIP